MRSGGGRQRVWALTLAVALVQLGRLAMLVRMPAVKLVQYVPDDAFYYLILGKNFAATGRWTFDGVEPASGFHLLWGYLVAAMYALAPDAGLARMVLATGVIQLFCVVAATWLTADVAERLLGPRAVIGLAAIFLAAATLDVGLGMMEAALVMLAAAATVWLLARTDASKSGLGWAAALGFAGMMARSDFGLLPACLLAMQVFLWRKRLTTAVNVRSAWSILAGSAGGFVVVLLHTHWISGEWFQASAQQKLFWGRQNGFAFTDIGNLLLGFFAPPASLVIRTPNLPWLVPVWTWSVVMVLLAGLWLAWRGLAMVERIVLTALALTIFAYMALYRFDGASGGPWYLGIFVVPAALLVGASFSALLKTAQVTSFVLLTLLCVVGLKDSLIPRRPWQMALYYAGMYVREHPELGPVGSWNAGAIAYFAGGGVINIDGLVNDRILPYAKAGTLLDYVQGRGIRTIVDYDAMFRRNATLCGGYADGKLQACLEPLDFLAETPALQGFSKVMVYRMKPECTVVTKR